MRLRNDTFYQYLKIRTNQAYRLLRDIGLPRSLFILTLFSAILYALLKTESIWIMPASVVTGLWLYHNERKDRQFLFLHTHMARIIFRKEYILAGTPFILTLLLKKEFLPAGILTSAALLLPGLKSIKLKSSVLPLPFLSKRALEYRHMFRKYAWLYIILAAVALSGSLHGNTRVGKVCLIIWGVIQSGGLMNTAQRQQLVFYLNFRTFLKCIILSSIQNVAVTGAPFLIFVVAFSPTGWNCLFSLSVLSATILYLWNVSMARFLYSTPVTLGIHCLLFPLPLYVSACFISLVLPLFFAANVILSITVKNKYKRVWN